jgi:hypothetical protein
MSTHGFKYVGAGARVSYGVPARDLSAEAFARLNPLDQRHVEQSDLYQPITAAEAKQAEAEAKKRAEAEAKAAADAAKQEGGDR